MDELALYTTVHPGTRPFLGEWYESLRAQTDSGFELWIGIDDLDIQEARKAMGGRPGANWIQAGPGDTPAQVRERAWTELIPNADAVIMVDADDAMHPRRVECAREHISRCDVGACGLKLVDEEGNSIGHAMPPPEYDTPKDVLPHHNIFGLSNTVYRTQALEKGLPLPKSITLIDWYLATQAWLRGGDLSLDRTVRMSYRQHGGSTLSLLPPFTAENVRRTSEAVVGHFSAVACSLPSKPHPERLSAFRKAYEDLRQFKKQVLDNDERLEEYTSTLNQRPPLLLWWGCVAYPELDHFWNKPMTE
ncbi:conserved hypothetical protein [Salinibacter ruber M8]|uniref:Glycosyltransferase 2-like domain-containing protein n=1 Tax=Salinibacter ruber (strain M8) TaxID=761659 RepID=D5H6G4_SALRM|nr:hypothetical protein [Salinibacter ruber]CBH23619.1 conserved hypothetical protein [Salinibacter ruber M8]